MAVNVEPIDEEEKMRIILGTPPPEPSKRKK